MRSLSSHKVLLNQEAHPWPVCPGGQDARALFARGLHELQSFENGFCEYGRWRFE